MFWIFFAVSGLGLIVTILLVPETKGYDADEVDRQELAAKYGVTPGTKEPQDPVAIAQEINGTKA